MRARVKGLAFPLRNVELLYAIEGVCLCIDSVSIFRSLLVSKRAMTIVLTT